MPPRRIDEFDVYEFHIIVAEEKGVFTAVGRDKTGNEVYRKQFGDLEEIRADVRSKLSALSDDFVGYEGAVNQFLRVYPGGFSDPYFLHDERNYKVKAHEKAMRTLDEGVLRELFGKKKFLEIGEAARKTFINLIFPNEAMAFKSFVQIERNAEAFSPLFIDLLYGHNFESAFDEMSALLRPARAATWTVLTYWPFIRFPGRHMFLKPEVAQESARRLGEIFDYESPPTAASYASYLNYVSNLRTHISALGARDNIDLQTFMYAVGKSGFVREGVERRRFWLAAQ